MTAQFKRRISRLYDGPLVSSLTAVAFITLSIILNINLI